jgi:exodeoxyribonuclease VII small subunit
MAQKNFETSMKRLEEIVHDLEKGDLPLEDSLKVFEEGMDLIKFCSEKLEEVEQKVTMLVKEGNGKYAHRPFDVEKDEED